MKSLILMVKGFIMGIANIIPGVSGGTLAMTLGIYEKFISSISHLFKNFKENLMFLIPIFVGIGLSLLTMSRVIDYSYVHFALPTTLFFVGLVLGGIPMIAKKIKREKMNRPSNWVIFLLTFGLVIFMAFADIIFTSMGNVDLANLSILGFVMLFFVGVIAAATMVIPGVSGSLMLMLLGYYYPIIGLIKNLTSFQDLGHNLVVAGVFGLGILVGIVGISKLIEFLFQKFELPFYYGVLGFMVASVPAILISAVGEVTFVFSALQVIAAIIFLALGGFVSYKLGEK